MVQLVVRSPSAFHCAVTASSSSRGMRRRYYRPTARSSARTPRTPPKRKTPWLERIRSCALSASPTCRRSIRVSGVMRSMLEACAKSGARFVFAYNLYMYSPQTGPLTEVLPLTDYGWKPRVRAESAMSAFRVPAQPVDATQVCGRCRRSCRWSNSCGLSGAWNYRGVLAEIVACGRPSQRSRESH